MVRTIVQAWLVESAHGSERDWRPARASLIFSTQPSKSLVDRANRSGFHTTKMSFSQSCVIVFDFRIAQGESRAAREVFLADPYERGLRGQALKLMVTCGARE